MKLLNDAEFGQYILDCQKINKKVDNTVWIGIVILILCIMTIVLVALLPKSAWAFETEASYYTVASCHREGTSGIMANGKALKDEEYTFASWDYRFGQRVKITNIRNNRSVVAVCTDRGPSKRLYRKGRKIDLSLAAFKAIEDTSRGVAKVSVEVIYA